MQNQTQLTSCASQLYTQQGQMHSSCIDNRIAGHTNPTTEIRRPMDRMAACSELCSLANMAIGAGMEAFGSVGSTRPRRQRQSCAAPLGLASLQGADHLRRAWRLLGLLLCLSQA